MPRSKSPWDGVHGEDSIEMQNLPVISGIRSLSGLSLLAVVAVHAVVNFKDLP